MIVFYGVWFCLIGFNTANSLDGLWTCNNGYCQKEFYKSNNEGYSSLKLCKLMCSDDLNTWPLPTGKIKSKKELVNINTENIKFKYNGPIETVAYLTKVAEYFEENIKKDEPFTCKGNLMNLVVILSPVNNDVTLNLDTDESYTFSLHSTDKEIKINLTASSVFGIRHGLETLLQLVIPHTENGSKCLSTLSYVQLSDQPKYKHRGLLIDTARNYLHIDTIKKQIDGMAVSKLNVLHWHMTDSQSFPLQSTRLPNMTRFGAYSPSKIYTPDNIVDLTQYAEYRGVRILIEIDGPAHAGMGWQWGAEAGVGNLAVCVNKQPWRSFCIQPPCGQLNPANQNVYRALEKLYFDISDVSKDTKMFHMGGDEVFIPCWNSTPEILNYIQGKPLTEKTFLDLWAEFQRKNLNAYDSAIGHSKNLVIVWTSHLTQPEVITGYLPKDRYIIQTWVTESENDLITNLINLGYKIIISTKDRWYLDHGFWGSTKYYKWKTVYENPIYENKTEAILGGEVCMWGELVDDSNIDSKVWPRAAAAAERLWSDPLTSADLAQNRFFSQRERLVIRGLHADAVIPEWCLQNEGECNTYL